MSIYIRCFFGVSFQCRQGVNSGCRLTALDVTPHIARKAPYSATDVRTTCHPGYQVSQRKRKLVEQVFGWMKTVGGLRKLRHRGGALADWTVTFSAAAYNLVRLRTLVATRP